jgi:deoxycytidine triphosphate deaminase
MLSDRDIRAEIAAGRLAVDPLDESRIQPATVEGTSTNGRCGLVVHSTAGFIDPGFYGMVTLELSNVNTLPVELTPGDVIGQLCFFRLATPAAAPYHGRYQGQHGPWAPRPATRKGDAAVP